MTTYHVTWTSLLPKILKQGLRCMQTSNWVNRLGERYGGGAVYAFESRRDAIRWAGRMDWDHTRNLGSGKVVILTLEDVDGWDTDLADALSQATCEGRWLKRFAKVPPSAITKIERLLPEMVRELIEEDKCTK